MARPPRIEYEGAVYHEETYGCVIHAYVLMTNHYHLLLETPRPNLSRVMHCMNGSYTTYVNSKRRKVGHLFQGRFQALIVDREAYLLELTRSIHLNPVRAAIVARPEAYPHSSYRAFLSADGGGLVTPEPTVALIDGHPPRAREQYGHFVEAGLGGSLPHPLEKP